MRWRRKQRRVSRAPAFEGINITPFTDILLVLLIIFMIAGSSLAPTGLELQGLEVGEATEAGVPVERLGVWISTDGATQYELKERKLIASELEALARNTPTVLMVAPQVSVDLVVREYDRLLRLGFTQVSFAPPVEGRPDALSSKNSAIRR